MSRRLFDRVDIGVGMIVLSTLVAYIPVYRAGFIWDDDNYVTDNSTLQTVDGLRRIWSETGATPQYYPVTFTSFWIENHLWGLSPVGYHVVNVLLHAAGAVLLWRVLMLLRLPGALVAAMVFALHPINVESVAWISERKNVLSGFCYLGAALAYLRWARFDEPDSSARRSWGLHVLAIFLFLCAILAKSVTATLPIALLLIYWWKRRRMGLREVASLVPFFVAALAMALITITVERSHVGTEHLDWNLGSLDRLLIAGRAACFYLWKLVWPHPLTFIYPRWEIDRGQTVQYLYPLAVMAVVVLLFALRRRIGRGPCTAALYYLVTLAPAMGIILAYPMRFSFVADHFCYLASIGPIAFVCAVLTRYCQGSPALTEDADLAQRSTPVAGIAIGGVVLAMLGAHTWQQSRIYQDLETLWRNTIAQNPGAWIAENNLGQVLLERHQLDEAIEHFSAATRIYPEYPEAQNNLGIALLGAGRLDDAAVSLQEALRIVPDYLNARFNLGLVRARQGRMEDAAAEFREALQVNSYFIPAYISLAQALAMQGKIDDALAAFDRGVDAFGDRPGAARMLCAKAGMLLAIKKMDDAIEACQRAVRLAPDDAFSHLTLANTLFQAGKIEEAAVAYEKCLSLDPNAVQAHFNLGVILVSAGKPSDALAHFDTAVRIKPDYAEAHFNRAQLLEAAGRTDEAAEAYREVLRLAPQHSDAQKRLDALLLRMKGSTPTSSPST